MKRLLTVFVLLSLVLSACAPDHEASEIVQSTAATASESTFDAVAEPFSEQTQMLIDQCALFFPECNTAYIKGKAYALPLAPFFEDGLLYVPVAPVCAAFGGSFVDAGDYYYINYLGNVSILMESYNILLFNSDAVIMDRTPILRQGNLCLPLSALGTALSRKYAKNTDAEVYVLGVQEYPSAQVLCQVRQQLLGESVASEPQEQLLALAQTYNLDYAELEQAADLRNLFQSDAQGQICELWLDDVGELHTNTYTMSARFPENQVFVQQGNQLKSLCTGKTYSDTAEQLYCKELRQATGRYMELLAACTLNGDTTAMQLLNGYQNAIGGELSDPIYLADQAEPYDTALCDGRTGRNGWEQLVSSARAGDFLVFSSENAGAKYGFFNHSALILDVDRTNGVVHLLHARSGELGVGSDSEMDKLSFDAFESVDYYENYNVVFLCRAGELSNDCAKELADSAAEKFRDYQFGYGGSLGLKETNCAELIVDAYAQQNISFLDNTYETRLKEVLKGNTKNLVPIPDDLLFSPVTEVLAVWTR